MAVTVTAANPQGTSTKKWDIIATADADTTTGNIAHGFGTAPFVAFVQARTAAGALSTWQVSTVDATNIVCNKSTAVGSGAAPVQATLYAFLPHSISA